MKTVLAFSTGIFVGMVIGVLESMKCNVDDPNTWDSIINNYQNARNKNDTK